VRRAVSTARPFVVNGFMMCTVERQRTSCPELWIKVAEKVGREIARYIDEKAG